MVRQSTALNADASNEDVISDKRYGKTSKFEQALHTRCRSWQEMLCPVVVELRIRYGIVSDAN